MMKERTGSSFKDVAAALIHQGVGLRHSKALCERKPIHIVSLGWILKSLKKYRIVSFLYRIISYVASESSISFSSSKYFSSLSIISHSRAILISERLISG